jgi:cytoskeletal protein CcmA (bactofilin family)
MLKRIKQMTCLLTMVTFLAAGLVLAVPAWADDPDNALQTPEVVLERAGQQDGVTEEVETGGITFDVVPAYGHGDAPIITIAKGQLVQETVFYAGETVNIDGKIEGTAFIAAQSVNITGEIDGDLFIAARDVRLGGIVRGNVYLAGQSVWLEGKVTGDVFGAGQSVYVTEDARLARDVFFAGELVSQLGPVGRAFYAGASKLNLQSQVGQNVRVEVEQMAVESGAVIGGDLRYTSPNEATISQGATIDGEIVWKKPQPPQERPMENPFLKGLKKFVFSLLAAFLVWLIVRAIWPRSWDAAGETLRRRPGASFGYGALVLFLAPIAIIVLLVTVVGIPLALMTGSAYASALYLTQIVVAVLLGRLVAERFGWRQIHWGLWTTLGALAVLKLLGMIPLIGVLVGLTVGMAGLGALLLSLLGWGRPLPGQPRGIGYPPGPQQPVPASPLGMMPSQATQPEPPLVGDLSEPGVVVGDVDNGADSFK